MNTFISYSRHSAAVTEPLAEDIRALGHSAWYDQELGGGQAWWAQILEKIRGCDVFVFVLDPASLNSTACAREWNYASALGKPILPVLVSDEVSTNLLPPALSQIQFVDYRTQDRDAAIRLARSFATLPPAGPLPDPLPTPPETPVSYLGSLTAQVGTAATLTYEEQCGLLTDLRRSLRDPETANDARTLLVTLRHRRELFASVAEEIDDLLGTHEPPPAAAPPVSAGPVQQPEPTPVQPPVPPEPVSQPEQVPTEPPVETTLTTTAPVTQPAAPVPQQAGRKSRVVPIVAIIAVVAILLLSLGGYVAFRALTGGDTGEQTDGTSDGTTDGTSDGTTDGTTTNGLPTYADVVATYPEGATTIAIVADLNSMVDFGEGAYGVEFVGTWEGVDISGLMYLKNDTYDGSDPGGVLWYAYGDTEFPEPVEGDFTEYVAFVETFKASDPDFAYLHDNTQRKMLGPQFTSYVDATFGDLVVSGGDLLTFDASQRLVQVSEW